MEKIEMFRMPKYFKKTGTNIYKKTLMQSIKYATKIVFISVLFYWRSFDEQQNNGSHLLT